MYKIEKKSYFSAPIDYGEIVRYAGAKKPDDNLTTIIKDCAFECENENAVSFGVCFTETPIAVKRDITDFTAFKIKSENLAAALQGATSALVFACTIGLGIDRLIKKYSEIDPLRALIFQAFGAERIESFINVFLADYEKAKGVKLTRRFSAGYGDLPLSVQKDVFGLLNPQKFLGLTLNDSLLMSPSKSVTAFVGINGTEICKESACNSCDNVNCGYRR